MPGTAWGTSPNVRLDSIAVNGCIRGIPFKESDDGCSEAR